MTTTVDRRVLNRTLLDRQRFHRSPGQGPLDTIEHLVGLQAQSPTAPYLGLFSRVGGFQQRQLSDLLVDRSAVRIVTMRSTVHLVSARDAIALRDWVQPALRRGLNTIWGPRLAGADLDGLTSFARDVLADGALSTRDLGVELNKKWPDVEPTALVNAVRVLLPLVQVPPRGLWGRSGQTTYATVHGWLDADPDDPPAPDFAEQIFLRYLKAFGPASVRDVQAWSGLTRLGEIADRLGNGLRRYRDEDGVELLDPSDGRLVDADSPVGPIFVAPYDNVILSHADRRRVISDADRAAIQTKNGIVPGTVLIDGFVAGTWRVDTVKKAATLVVTPFRKLTRAVGGTLEAPARSLAEFVADTAESHAVLIERPS